MRPRRALAVLAVLAALGCQGAAMLDAADDMFSGPRSVAPSAVGSICNACFSGTCAWQVSECASDPSCAGWLTCASSCEFNGMTSPWASDCVLACEQPRTGASVALQQALVQCVHATDDCCGLQSTAGSGGAAETGDGSSPQPDYDGASDAGVAGHTECGGQTCRECLFNTKLNGHGCTDSDSDCSESVSNCRHEVAAGDGPCWLMTTMRDCTLPAANRECGQALPDESMAVTASAMRCAAKHCPQCAPAGDRACMFCQLDRCPDEMRALWQDPGAQQLFWCREACSAAKAQAECRADCWANHAGGSTVVEALGVCTMETCAGACNL